MSTVYSLIFNFTTNYQQSLFYQKSMLLFKIVWLKLENPNTNQTNMMAKQWQRNLKPQSFKEQYLMADALHNLFLHTTSHLQVEIEWTPPSATLMAATKELPKRGQMITPYQNLDLVLGTFQVCSLSPRAHDALWDQTNLSKLRLFLPINSVSQVLK